MIGSLGWAEAKTLKEAVFALFDAHKTDSNEFKALLAYYGRKRMAELYEEWVASKGKQSL